MATKGGQTTMESDFWRRHIAKYAPEEVVSFRKSIHQNYGAVTVKEANEIAKSISALVLISDPPIFMQYGMRPNAPVLMRIKLEAGLFIMWLLVLHLKKKWTV